MSGAAPASEQAVPQGSPLWYALLFTPTKHKETVAALLELRADILAAARQPSEPMVARARLDWWRAELANFGSGREQHPLTRKLAGCDTRAAVQGEYLLELIDAAQSELTEAPCRNYAELSLYCYRSSGVLHEMLAGLFGLSDPANERAVRRHAQRLGTGVALVDIIVALRDDLRAERRLLPRDWIAETGAVEQVEPDGRMDIALTTCLDRIAGEARLALDEAEALLPPAEWQRQRPGRVLAALYRRHLAKLHANEFNPQALPGNLDNLWLAWRAARRAAKARA